MTARQAADRLGVGIQHVRRMLRRGILRGVRTVDGYVVDPASVEQYAKTRRKPGRPPKT